MTHQIGNNMEQSFIEEQRYLKAKKRVKDIKGFYIHLVIEIVSLIIIVTVNLVFSPGYHWFWFAAPGIVFVVILHWFLVFGPSKIGYGKDWEAKKIQELMDKDRKHSK
ncbi:hypothetical protein KCTC32516_02196 [Polaribacter huanghezhanensis]|nr:hypothetical protein KCTC32516_02196 [Polaribacter huanghezhanensis]